MGVGLKRKKKLTNGNACVRSITIAAKKKKIFFLSGVTEVAVGLALASILNKGYWLYLASAPNTRLNSSRD